MKEERKNIKVVRVLRDSKTGKIIIEDYNKKRNEPGDSEKKK
ncbi:hypothetical protein [Flavobacterium alkalisoli]|nr:hypothetical protein [Flavobacterium alkalisoli]